MPPNRSKFIDLCKINNLIMIHSSSIRLIHVKNTNVFICGCQFTGLGVTFSHLSVLTLTPKYQVFSSIWAYFMIQQLLPLSFSRSSHWSENICSSSWSSSPSPSLSPSSSSTFTTAPLLHTTPWPPGWRASSCRDFPDCCVWGDTLTGKPC